MGPMDRWPTWRWLATRLELGLGAVCLVIGPVLVFVAPGSHAMFLSDPSFLGVPLGDALLAMGCLGMIIGMLWMLRIARRSPEDGGPTIWRYRGR